MGQKMRQQLEDYFKPLDITNIIQSLLDYSPTFWNILTLEIYKLPTLTLKAKLLLKLMNEQYIKTIIPQYKFLLDGNRLKQQKRRQLLIQKQFQNNSNFLCLIHLLGRKDLPQYHCLLNIFIQQYKFNKQQFLSMIWSSLTRDRIKQELIIIQTQIGFNEQLKQSHFKKLYSLLNKINYGQIIYLLENKLNIQLYKQYINQSLITLIGPTGVGKSTIILLLLGYQLTIQKIGQLYQTVPKTTIQQQHKTIISKSSISSVTSQIHFVKFQYNNRNIVLVDTPGSGDTRGTSRKLFNLYLLNKFYQICKNVKIVQIIDMKKILLLRVNQIINYINHLKQNYRFDHPSHFKSYLTVIFNKCGSQSDIKKFEEMLKKMIKDQSNQMGLSNEDKQIIYFLWNEIDSNGESTPTAITSINGQQNSKRQQILHHIDNKKSIQNNMIRYRLNEQIKKQLKQNYEYCYEGINYFLSKQLYQYVLYYYINIKIIIEIDINKSYTLYHINQIIKNYFLNYINLFHQIIQHNSHQQYTQQHFIIIKKYIYILTQSKLFEPYIGQHLLTIDNLSTRKADLIHSYQQQIKKGRCKQYVIQNYKQFAKLFNYKINLGIQINKQLNLLYNKIQSIWKQQKYQQFDLTYQNILSLMSQINNLNPNNIQHSQLLQSINNHSKSNLQIIYSNIQEQINKQINNIRDAITNISTYLTQQPMNIQPLLIKYLNNYRQINNSKYLKQWNESIGHQCNQTIILQNIIDQLQKLIQSFNQFIINDNIQINYSIKKYFQIFISKYLKIQIININLAPSLTSTDQLIQRQIVLLQNDLQQYTAKLKIGLEQKSQSWAQINIITQKMNNKLKSLDLFMKFMNKNFDKDTFINSIIELIKNIQIKIIKHERNKKQQIQQIYAIQILDKYFFIKQLSINFSQLSSISSSIQTRLTEYFHILSEQFIQKISNRQRLLNFYQEIQQRDPSLLRIFKFIDRVGSKIRQLHFQFFQLEKLQQKFKNIFEVCEKILNFKIVYIQIPIQNIDEDANQNEVYIKKIFLIFKYLCNLSQLKFFIQKSQDDLRFTIVSKLTSQVQNIFQQIMMIQRLKNNEMYNNIYKKRYLLSDIQNLYLGQGDGGSKLINLKNRYRQLKYKDFEYIDDQQRQLIIPESNSLQQGLLIYEYEQYRALQKGQRIQNLFIKFTYFINKKIQQIRGVELNENNINYYYIQLNNINKKLLSKNQQILSLRYIEQIINQMIIICNKNLQYLEIMINNYQFKGQDKKIKEIKKIIQLLSQNQKINQIKIRFQKIKSIIQKQQKQIHSFKSKILINKNILNIYQDYQIIKKCLHNYHQNDRTINNIFINSIQKQIQSLQNTRKLSEINIFLTKKQKLITLITMIFSTQNYRYKNQQLLQEIKTCEQNIRQSLRQKIILFDIKLPSYLEVMYLCYYCHMLKVSQKKGRQLKSKYIRLIQQKIRQSNNIQFIFRQLLLFWIDKSEEHSKILDEFKYQNENDQFKFFQKIIKKFFIPQIQSIRQLLQNKRKIQKQINLNIIQKCLHLMEANKDRFYGRQNLDKIKKEILNNLSSLSSNILKIKRINTFEKISDEIRFGKNFQLINRIQCIINPNLKRKSRVDQFHDKIQQIKKQIDSFNNQRLIQIKNESILKQYFYRIYSNLRILRYYQNNNIYQDRFINQLLNIITKKEQILTSFFISQKSLNYKISLNQICLSIKLHNILPAIIELKLIDSSKLHIMPQLSNKLKQSIQTIKTQYISGRKYQKIFYIYRLKLISLFFKQLSVQSYQIIHQIIQSLQLQSLHHFLQLANPLLSQCPLNQLIINRIVQQYFKTNTNISIDCQHFKNYMQNQSMNNQQHTSQEKIKKYLKKFLQAYPQIQLTQLSNQIFQFIKYFWYNPKILVQNFFFHKYLNFSWKSKNIIIFILSAILALDNYKVYLIYSNENKKQSEEKKLNNFWNLAQISGDRCIIFTTYNELLTKITEPLKFKYTDQTRLLPLYEQNQEMLKIDNKNVFIFEDYYQVYNQFVQKRVRYDAKHRLDSLLHQLCKIIYKFEYKNEEQIFQQIKGCIHYKQIMKQQVIFRERIAIQIKKIIHISRNNNNNYIISNKKIYYLQNGLLKDAITSQGRHYETMLNYYQQYLMRNVEYSDYYKSLNLVITLYQTNFYHFITQLSSKSKIIGFTSNYPYLPQPQFQQASKQIMKIQRQCWVIKQNTSNDIISHIKLEQFQSSLLSSKQSQTLLIFEDYKVLQYFIEKYNLNRQQSQQTNIIIDERMNIDEILLKITASSVYKKRLLISIKAIQNITIFHKFTSISNARILINYIPNDILQMRQIIQKLTVICSIENIKILYHSETQKKQFYSIINNWSNNLNIKLNKIKQTIKQFEDKQWIGDLFSKDINIIGSHQFEN